MRGMEEIAKMLSFIGVVIIGYLAARLVIWLTET
jgi:hypothetical protein